MHSGFDHGRGNSEERSGLYNRLKDQKLREIAGRRRKERLQEHGGRFLSCLAGAAVALALGSAIYCTREAWMSAAKRLVSGPAVEVIDLRHASGAKVDGFSSFVSEVLGKGPGYDYAASSFWAEGVPGRRKAEMARLLKQLAGKPFVMKTLHRDNNSYFMTCEFKGLGNYYFGMARSGAGFVLTDADTNN